MKQHYWQDARFKKALQHAPDRELKPSEQTKNHILRAAEAALKDLDKEERLTWWHRLIQQVTPQSHRPLNAVWGVAIVAISAAVLWTVYDPDTAFEPSTEYLPPLQAPTSLMPEEPGTAMEAQPTPINDESNTLPEQNASPIAARPAPQPTLAPQTTQQTMREDNRAHVSEAPSLQSMAANKTPPQETESLRALGATVKTPIQQPTIQQESAQKEVTTAPSMSAEQSEALASMATTKPVPGPYMDLAKATEKPLSDTDFTVSEVKPHYLIQTLHHWETLELSGFGRTASFTKDDASWLEYLFSLITSIPERIEHMPDPRENAYALAFYTQDHQPLGTLFLEQQRWYFRDPQFQLFSGALSANQQQAIKILLDAHL